MEKPRGRSKGKRLLRFLPKAASFSVPNTPYSPARDRVHAHRAFSGPIVPMIPAEARGRETRGGVLEPTSPRVTCVGRVEFGKQDAGGTKSRKEGRARLAVLGWLFRRRARQGGRGGDDGEVVDGAPAQPAVAGVSTASGAPPTLGQMRRFGSGRDRFRGFGWRAPGVAEVECAEEPVEEEEEEDEEQVAMAGSTAVVVVTVDGGVGLEPRKEVNLWKRRAVAPLRPLQV